MHETFVVKYNVKEEVRGESVLKNRKMNLSYTLNKNEKS